MIVIGMLVRITINAILIHLQVIFWSDDDKKNR
jgi:hypothetical protein